MVEGYTYTYYCSKAGKLVTMKQPTAEEAAKSRSEFLDKEYEKGNLFFCMLDLSENSKGITNKINANPKFREDER